MERLQNAVLRHESEPGSRPRGGTLGTARIGTESLAEGNAECKNFKSMVGAAESELKFGGAERNRTADEGFADPCLATWLPRHSVLHATTTHQNEKPTCQVFRRWATIPWGWT